MNSASFSKKLDKKLRKHQHTISKHINVVCTNEPMPNLAICNVGQVNGLTEEKILENFEQFGRIEKILLIPGKSFSFLRYANKSSSIQAMAQLNGKLLMAQDNKPILLSYIENLPELNETTKIWHQLPPGLIILNDFITVEEEKRLLDLYYFNNNFDNNLKHRQVKHYGYEFRYDINNIDKDQPLNEKIPKECDFLWERLDNQQILKHKFVPDQLTINYYQPGQGIPSHIDTHSAFEDPIVVLSLNSSIIMEFRRNNQINCVLLPQRSLAIMSGECRYDWSHGIVPKKFDYIHTANGYQTFKRDTRVSLTFRRILQGDCRCLYTNNCDSYQNEPIISNQIATELENLHVYNVYEDIADHFSDTRHKPWPNVLNFVQSFATGSILVDVGCGNGKYFGHNNGIIEIGIDRCFKLNELCRERGFETFAGNCLNLTLMDCVADGVLSIAVIHHLANEERRLQAIKEIVRILRVNGRALIYVWAKDQIKNNEKSSYIKQERKYRKSETVLINEQNNEIRINNDITLPIHNNRTNFNYNDMLVPWKLKNRSENDEKNLETFLRFYHVFQQNELEELCKKIDGIEIISSYYDQGNYCVILKKLKPVK